MVMAIGLVLYIVGVVIIEISDGVIGNIGELLVIAGFCLGLYSIVKLCLLYLP